MKYQNWNDCTAPLAIRQAMEQAGVPTLAAYVLCARQLDTVEKARAFLADDESLLQDPLLLRDIEKAAARIEAAVAQGEAIAVYGDYDVDGITSTCLLTHYLRSRGGRVTAYIPDRLEEGYGLNREAVATLAAQGVTLIITVDCGITAVEETAYAQSLGVDVVITDHHECKDCLPAAVAVVDPHRPDCDYPFRALAGVGVALKLVLALGGAPQAPALLAEYADLAAIGTVADVMPVIGENRTILRLGLAALQHTKRPGLKALLAESGLADKPLTSVAIGYTLAPRMNASGRLGCAALAVELLLTEDASQGTLLAQKLCALNTERQSIERTIFQESVLMADALPSQARRAIVLASGGWHQGVVGIVASRLAEKYSCPAFMICLQDGKGKGSCRSYAGFPLFTALEQCASLLDGFGGHELAAGFTISEENIPAFREKMNQIVSAATGGAEMVSTLAVDGELSDPGQLTQQAVAALDVLEPYGAGNPKPVFSLSGCTAVALSAVGGGRHLKLKLSRGGQTLDGIFFSATAQDVGIAVGDRVDVAFYPQINEYRGWRTVQLLVTDLRPALTRSQTERALYEKFRRGEHLTATEAEALLPSRGEFANLWRYLKSRAQVGRLEETAYKLSRNLAHASHTRETFMRTMVCLEVMDERGLIRVEHSTDHLQIDLVPTQNKVDLDASHIMKKLRKIVDRK